MDHHRVVSLPFGTWPDQFLDHAIVTVHGRSVLYSLVYRVLDVLPTQATKSRWRRHREKTPPGGVLSKRDKESNTEISALCVPTKRMVAHFKKLADTPY